MVGTAIRTLSAFVAGVAASCVGAALFSRCPEVSREQAELFAKVSWVFVTASLIALQPRAQRATTNHTPGSTREGE